MQSISALAAAAAAALVLGSAGCAVVRNDYVEPTSGPAAQLTVVQPAGQKVNLRLYDDHRECQGRRVVTASTVKVPAGTPLSFSVETLNADTRRACFMIATFTPLTGQRYAARLALDGQRCTLDVRTQDGRTVALRARQASRSQITEASRFCTAD